ERLAHTVLTMASTLLLTTLCVLAVASASLLKQPHYSLPKTAQVPNFPGTCSTKDQATTKGCLDNYFSLFSIDSSTTLPEYFDYVSKMSSLVNLYGVNGIDIYCDFEATLESCMGPLMSSPCMNPEGFTALFGIGNGEATEYATSFQIEAYTCLNADLSKKYFTCMNNLNADNVQGFYDCSNAMNSTLQHATDPCPAMSTYVTCISDFYVGLCDQGIWGYICNSQEIAFNFDMNGQCDGKMPNCDA
ncbi:hypothetical protein PFISCL1PPCAC_4320, partial [Pristionchus fissidentatus]